MHSWGPEPYIKRERRQTLQAGCSDHSVFLHKPHRAPAISKILDQKLFGSCNQSKRKRHKNAKTWGSTIQRPVSSLYSKLHSLQDPTTYWELPNSSVVYLDVCIVYIYLSISSISIYLSIQPESWEKNLKWKLDNDTHLEGKNRKKKKSLKILSEKDNFKKLILIFLEMSKKRLHPWNKIQ